MYSANGLSTMISMRIALIPRSILEGLLSTDEDNEEVSSWSIYRVSGRTLKVVQQQETDDLNFPKKGPARPESLLMSVTREVESSTHAAGKLWTKHGSAK